MASIAERFSLSVVFDILLHQPPLLSTLHMMLAKTEDAITIVQPILKERETLNALVYLPGQPADSALYPLAERSEEYRAFDVKEVNQSHWIWGMTRSFIAAVLAGERRRTPEVVCLHGQLRGRPDVVHSHDAHYRQATRSG